MDLPVSVMPCRNGETVEVLLRLLILIHVETLHC